jgi:hypothetical protein
MSAEVTTLEELDSLDQAALLRGYSAGLKNDADFSEREKGYWHGYLNGLVDGKHSARPSEAQMKLARAYVSGKAA